MPAAQDTLAPSGPWRLVRHRISSTHSASEALRSVRGDRRPVCLSGAWFGGGTIVASEPLVVATSDDELDPFDLLDHPHNQTGSGVHGGWIGSLGYRSGRLVERLPDGPPRPHPLPEWWLGFYDHVLRFDPRTGWWFEALWSEARAHALEERRHALTDRLTEPPPAALAFECGEFVQDPSPDEHMDAVRAAVAHIQAGDIYQANVCLRLEAPLQGEALDLFCRGIDTLAPPHAAFVDLGDRRAVASLSPEQFLVRRGRRVATRPIKGTRRRTGPPVDDAASRAALEASAKDHAENVMIVDLMRNDLGRVCVPGSIDVPRLFGVEAHPGVWHLVSEVDGRLRDDVGDGALLRATFPPGSVTGAPKVRAMEVIAEVEATSRETYTGALGMVSPTAGAEWNVAIRTFEISDDVVWLGAGGGIVADSQPDAEWHECRTKARPLIEAIGSSLAEVSPSGGRP